jgi:transcription elongation factor/antiterminator RfaH
MTEEAKQNTRLTTAQVADRFGIGTPALSELRLQCEDLPIERDGFKLFYQLPVIRAFEQRQTLSVFEKVLAAERPLVMLRRMVEASGLSKVQIAGQLIHSSTDMLSDQGVRSAGHQGTQSQPALSAQAGSGPVPDEKKTARRPLDGSHPWYVVHTKPRQEDVALENLERQGYSCYLPRLRVKKPVARKLALIDEPMFPRYLFIGVNDLFVSKGSSPIRSTRGVSGLVRFGSDPAQIRFELLNAIFMREQVQHQKPEQPFKPGDHVTFAHGPLAGIESIYEAANGEERSMVLLRLLNRPVKLQVDTAQLRKTA